MLNTNQINYEILGPTEEELEAMYEDDCLQKLRLEEDLGEYLEDYKREIAVLHARLEAYEDSQRTSIYESLKKKNSMIKAYRSLRRAA